MRKLRFASKNNSCSESLSCWWRKQAAILSTSYLSFTKGHRLHWQILFSPPFSSALSLPGSFKMFSPLGTSLSSFSFSSPQTLKDNKRHRNGYLNLKQGDYDKNRVSQRGGRGTVPKSQPFMKVHPHVEKAEWKILFWNNATHLAWWNINSCWMGVRSNTWRNKHMWTPTNHTHILSTQSVFKGSLHVQVIYQEMYWAEWAMLETKRALDVSL